jgi:predicted permease
MGLRVERLLARLRGLSRRPTPDEEIRGELEAHVALHAAEAERRGLSAGDAKREALLRLGGMARTTDAVRDRRRRVLVDDCQQDLRLAIRLLLKDRSFTVTAVAALALGIAVNSTMFTFIDDMFLLPLPFDRASEVVAVATRDTDGPIVAGPPGFRGVSYPDVLEWRDTTRSFSEMAAYREASMVVGDETHAAERASGSFVSWNTFSLIGQQPIIGRSFQFEDDQPGAPPVVLLGDAIWRTRYGGDRGLVGRTIRVNGLSTLVIGVMPPSFRFPQFSDVWQPLTQTPELSTAARGSRILSVVARLRSGTTLAAAQADLSAVAARVAQTHPETNEHVAAVVMPYAERYVATQMRLVLGVLMGAVLCVLLVACANVAHLLLARGHSRRSEVAVRLSLGATRGRLLRQLLMESLVLATIAGVIGLTLATAAIGFLRDIITATNPPYWLRLDVNPVVLTLTAALSLGSAVVCGLVPALLAGRDTPQRHLATDRTGASPAVGRWCSGALMVGQITLTLVLLAGASLMMRALWTMVRTDIGIDTDAYTVMRLDLTGAAAATPDLRTALIHRLDERLRALPFGTTLATVVPGAGAPLWELAIEGRPRDGLSRVSQVAIGPRYFETLGRTLLRGRAFTTADSAPSQTGVIVNARLAALHFRDSDPIGQRIQLTAPRSGRTPFSMSATVVGLAPDIRQGNGAEAPPDPVIYIPWYADPTAALNVIARGTSERPVLAAVLRDEVRAVDPDLPLSDIGSLGERLTFLRWPQRVFGAMLLVFATITLVLSVVGTYGVTAHLVATRRIEIGIRMALGARVRQVTGHFVRRTATSLAIGLGLGLAGAVAFQRVLQSTGVLSAPEDATVLLFVAGGLGSVVLSASLVPARRAARISPMVALRHE